MFLEEVVVYHPIHLGYHVASSPLLSSNMHTGFCKSIPFIFIPFSLPILSLARPHTMTKSEGRISS